MKNSFLKAWNEYWFARIPAYPVAAFRICFGSYLLLYFLSFWPHVSLFFSNGGIYVPFFAPFDLPSPLREGIFALNDLSLAGHIAPAPVLAWLIYLLTLALTLAFTLGYRTRLVTPLLFGFYLYHFFLSLAVKNCSYDRLIIIFFVMLCFGELDRVWSVNPSLSAHGDRTVSAWLTRLLCLQISLFYFGTGFYKLLTPYWHHGAILTMTMTSNWGSPAGFWLVNLGLPMWVFSLMTWSVIAFELSCGFLFYFKKVQKWVFALGLAFHLSVWIFLNIPEFLLCPLTYVIFLPPEELQKLGEWVAEKALQLKAQLLAKAYAEKPAELAN